MRRVVSSFVLGTAAAAGTAARVALSVLDRGGLSVAGAVLVTLGLTLIYPPLGWLGAGLFALIADWGRQR